MKKYSSIFVLILVLATGCSKYEKIEKSGTITPKLIINCVAAEGDQFVFNVSKSLNAIDNAPMKTYKYATLKLYGNGVLKEVMKYNASFETYFSDTTVARAGVKYTLEATAPGLESVNAELILPEKVVIDDVLVEIKGIDKKLNSGSYYNNIFKSGKISVKFQNKKDRPDYYMLSLEDHWSANGGPRYYGFSSWKSTYPNVESIADYMSQNGGQFFFFKDDFNDGKQINFELTTSSEYNYIGGGSADSLEKYRINLYSLTEDYYKHLFTIKTAQSNEGNAFTQPTQIFCNIKNGYGIFGAMWMDQKDVLFPY